MQNLWERCKLACILQVQSETRVTMRNQALHPRTAAINQKQKNLSKKARQDALIWLAKTFPKAFDNTVSIQPLNLGIMDDILAYADQAAIAGISKSKLREAVVVFTRRLDYLACLKAREMRIDLNGNPVALVSEEEADHAAAKIKKRIEKAIKMTRKNASVPAPKKNKPAAYLSSHEMLNHPDYAVNTSSRQSNRVPVVMHKQSRQYDPEAVARLKEKLGLRKPEEVVE